jgi:hypothetical protein
VYRSGEVLQMYRLWGLVAFFIRKFRVSVKAPFFNFFLYIFNFRAGGCGHLIFVLPFFIPHHIIPLSRSGRLDSVFVQFISFTHFILPFKFLSSLYFRRSSLPVMTLKPIYPK